MDRYVEEKAIGKGSYGSVYLCRRKKDNARFCIKKMKVGNISKKEREQYDTEIHLLSKLVSGCQFSICFSFLRYFR